MRQYRTSAVGGKAALDPLDPLDRFWREGFPRGAAAQLLADRVANTACVRSLRLPVAAGVSPYARGRRSSSNRVLWPGSGGAAGRWRCRALLARWRNGETATA